ncbi:hypothetical protein FACS189451_03710 [Bacteroidia bacterium]|nr:hypothetical protein FACS189446_8170 [Bacteroidia bacterium]GHT61524.1 hypothetical protein FACS189451_03710 [Bacteroidia bacterium]
MVQKEYPAYGVYKGLQKPLEFMGLQGRYIAWAAIGILSCFILFAVSFACFGLGTALVALIIGLAFSVGLIGYKQRSGLHSKNKMKGVHIVTNVFKIK